MKFAAYERLGNTKGETNKIRREGDIPAVLYGPKFANKNIFIKGVDFTATLRNIKKGSLGALCFSISFGDTTYSAVVKDIQYDIITYKPIHIDFEVVDHADTVSVNVPIELKHAAECQGVKLGGALRQVIRHLKVRCHPKKIPKSFSLDVENLKVGESLKLDDIELPEAVSTVAKMQEVAVVVAKR